MATKSNIRSMRFSDTVIEMIEAQAGETFTAKFEALVTRCVWELPRKEAELKIIQERINRERERLNKIQSGIRQMENAMFKVHQTMNQTYGAMKNAADNLNSLIEEA